MRFGLPAIIALTAFAYSTDAFSVNSFGTHVMPSSSSSSSSSWMTATQLHAEASKVFMPALSSTMKEGKVVTWLKEEGDEIEAGEAIMVVESDKADMDVEAFEDGFLAKIIVGEGEVAPVGEAVALIAASKDEIDAVAAGGAGGAAAPPAAAAEAPAAPAAAASGKDRQKKNLRISMNEWMDG